VATRTPEPTAARLVRAQAVIEAFPLMPGGGVLFVKRVVDGDRYLTHLWVAPWRGGRESVLRPTVTSCSPR
jgi:hypothetical protein